jgi:hypothetical protein
MTRNFIMALAGILLVTTPALPAPKSKRDSVYTGTVNQGCTSLIEEEMHCKGADGWHLDISDEGNIITLGIGHDKAKAEPLVLTGRFLGDKAEWRGTRSAKRFRADALIVRMRPVEDDETTSNLLYIIKLNPVGACFSGLVDAKVNANANALARTAADKLPDMCDPYPQVYGQRSAATDMFGS